MPDSISATLSLSPKVSIVRYITQSLFLFLLATASIIAIVMDYSNKELWVMVLVLCISQVLNLPMIDIVSMINNKDKGIKGIDNV